MDPYVDKKEEEKGIWIRLCIYELCMDKYANNVHNKFDVVTTFLMG